MPEARALLSRIYPHSQHGFAIGVTGSPGVGKSSLCDALVARFRSRGQRVGVVAVDPSSPFKGGALLGDRIRLQRHFEDPGVFIRSLATRGALGGLSRSAVDVVRLVRAWGADLTLIETVGVGQDELDVCRSADLTLLVVAPGLGDGVQALKAGIIEVADVLCVNKADREGAERTVADLELALELAAGNAPMVAGHGPSLPGPGSALRPPVLCTVATSGQGVDELVQALDAARAAQATEPGQLARRERERAEVERWLLAELGERLLAAHADRIAALVARVQAGELSPYQAADELFS